MTYPYPGGKSTLSLTGTRRYWHAHETWDGQNVGVSLEGGNVGVMIEHCSFANHIEAGLRIGDPNNIGNDSEGQVRHNWFKDCAAGIHVRTPQTKAWHFEGNHFLDCGTAWLADGHLSPINGGSVGCSTNPGMIIDVLDPTLSPIVLRDIFAEGISHVGHIGHGHSGKSVQCALFSGCRFNFVADRKAQDKYHLYTFVRTTFSCSSFGYTGGASDSSAPVRIRRYDGVPLFFAGCALPSEGVVVTGPGPVIIDGVVTNVPGMNPVVLTGPY